MRKLWDEDEKEAAKLTCNQAPDSGSFSEFPKFGSPVRLWAGVREAETVQALPPL